MREGEKERGWRGGGPEEKEGEERERRGERRERDGEEGIKRGKGEGKRKKESSSECSTPNLTRHLNPYHPKPEA